MGDTIGDLIAKITGDKPNHLSINFNEPWSVHETVKESVQDADERGVGIDFASEREKQACIEQNKLWEVQYYPRTPIGFYLTGGLTLESALRTMLECLKEREN